MALPIKYNIRNIIVRWRTTIATILGVALVVSVYVVLQAMAAGLEKNSMNTGDPENLLVVRKGSNAESGSQITRQQYQIMQYHEEVARDEKGQPLISADLIVLANLQRKDLKSESNVQLRGTSPNGRFLRPQVTLLEGRWFTPGKREVVVAKGLSARFANMEIGNKFRVGPNELTVVGYLNGNKSAFDSEIWLDADEARGLFDRTEYSSVLLKPVNAAAREKLVKKLENDKRMVVRAVPEVDYYKAQTMTATPIKFLGNFLATAMSIGAVCAAMNTMYAMVASRTREVGTLRVLGYKRRTILLSFLMEGAILAFLGGLLGCALSFCFNGYAMATLNFDTFSEVLFEFRITPPLIIKGLIFSVIVGLAGSLLPSMRAARLPVIAALKAI